MLSVAIDSVALGFYGVPPGHCLSQEHALYFWGAGTPNFCLASLPGEERTPFLILPYDLSKAEESLAPCPLPVGPCFSVPNGRLLKACSSFLLQGRERKKRLSYKKKRFSGPLRYSTVSYSFSISTGRPLF